MVQSQIARILFLLIAVPLAWGGLALQFHVLFPDASVRDAGHALVTFFSALIIVGNLLMALALSVTLLLGRRFPSASLMTGLAVAVVLVAFTHAVVPVKWWAPHDEQWLAEMALHYVMPAVFALFWILFEPKGRLHWSAPFLWLAWPIVYVGWAIAGLTGFSSHALADVIVRDMPQLAYNAIWIATVFLLAGLFAAILDKILGPLVQEENA